MKMHLANQTTQTVGGRLRQRSSICFACANGSSHFWIQASTNSPKRSFSRSQVFIWTRGNLEVRVAPFCGGAAPHFALVQITIYGTATMTDINALERRLKSARKR